MKKEIADKWVAALRSGHYKQCRNQLRSKDNSFCCLGVLCNLHAEAHPEKAARQLDPNHYFGYSTVVPPNVESWAGLSDPSGTLFSLRDCPSLARYNDDGKTFAEIADIIEQHWEIL